jgi:hypothetical protein
MVVGFVVYSYKRGYAKNIGFLYPALTIFNTFSYGKLNFVKFVLLAKVNQAANSKDLPIF